MTDLIDYIKSQSRAKMTIAGMLVAGILFMALLSPRDPKYFEAVQKEIQLAMLICEESEEWIYEYTDELKMDDNVLDEVKVNGRHIQLKLVEYPKVLLFSQGFEHTRKRDELFCSFQDPRSGAHYFYSYKTKTWEQKSRTRL